MYVEKKKIEQNSLVENSKLMKRESHILFITIVN